MIVMARSSRISSDWTLLAFPFLVGLAIWQASWDEAVRLTLIVVLATYTYMFVPRARKR